MTHFRKSHFFTLFLLLLAALAIAVWWGQNGSDKPHISEGMSMADSVETAVDTIDFAEEVVPPEGDTPEEQIDRRFTYAGKPEPAGYPNPLTVLYNECFVVGYDEIRGAPAWVAYRVFHTEDYSTAPRRSRFLIDDRTENRISHNDYTNSGFDRGHMAPNFAIASRYGADCQRETFLMTNIIPQKSGLNRQWWQQLERLIARDYTEKYDEVWVITGPVYIEKDRWIREKVKIPCHNFKIIIAENAEEIMVKAFLVDQEVTGSDAHSNCLTSVRKIEELTGLNFNPLWQPLLADSLESAICPQMWN